MKKREVIEMINIPRIIAVIVIIGLVWGLDYLGINMLPLLSAWQLYAIIFLYLLWRLVRAVEKWNAKE
jgi:purine-cytosine permease-like protein